MQILKTILVAAIVGILAGGAAAYIQVRVDPDVTSLPAGLSDGPAIAEAAENAARVEAVEPNFDFGTMQRGTTRSHNFTVKNVGTAPLRLTVGQTSCKCTLGDVTGDAIPPGESTHVTLEWSAKSDQGPFRQTAMILTNDPVQSQVELSIEGKILEASGVVPSQLAFDKIPAGDSRTAEVYVMAMLQDDLSVTDPEMSDPSTRDKFDVKIEPVKNDQLPDPSAKKGVRITLTAKPGLPIGRFDQWLSLKTNLPEAEKLEVPVIGRVVGDISVYGSKWNDSQGVLILGKVKSVAGAKEHVNIVVRGQGAKDVKFEVQSVDPPELKVKIGEPKRLKDTLLHVPVEIEVPAGTSTMVRLQTAQGDEGRIVLKTTHPTIKELAIGVRFAVER
jgi:hypothetical protein